MDEQQAEIESAVYTTPVHNENEVLMELAVGESIDCIVAEMQEATGRMSSPMLHGVRVAIGLNDAITPDESQPFKMWAPTSLENAFKGNRRLIGLALRIRRTSDAQFGALMGKTFRISALKELLARIAKDKP